MSKRIFKRKIYSKILEWKQEKGTVLFSVRTKEGAIVQLKLSKQ